MRCLYFGCWNTPGHYLHTSDGSRVYDLEYYGKKDRTHLDGTLAPRRLRGGGVGWGAMDSAEPYEPRRRTWRSAECPQGEFLRHELDAGFTAIQWWDRCQGDTRGACNSTLLLEGRHTSEEMLAALAEHFPHVLANLKKLGVELVEVKP